MREGKSNRHAGGGATTLIAIIKTSPCVQPDARIKMIVESLYLTLDLADYRREGTRAAR
jgi:hypothetical protein